MVTECTYMTKEKNMALGVRFQKLIVGGGGLLSGVAEFSEAQGRATFSGRARFSRAIMYFFIRVISMSKLLFIIYSYVYSNIVDIAECLTQKDYGPI